MNNLRLSARATCLIGMGLIAALWAPSPASSGSSSLAFDCHDIAEICGPVEIPVITEIDGPYTYFEGLGGGGSYETLVDGRITGSGCGSPLGCHYMRIDQNLTEAKFRFDFSAPQNIYGIVVWNDRNETGDGVADLAVELYDAGGNLLKTFATPMEDLTTEHMIYFGDPALTPGEPGALQTTPNVAYAIWQIRGFHGDPGPDNLAHQLREVGYNPVLTSTSGYTVIAVEESAVVADTPVYDVCTHPCPSKIRLRRVQKDFFYLRLGMNLPDGFDPATSEFKVTVQSDGNPVFEGTLFAGDVIQRGHKWSFRDRTARRGAGTRDGISLMSMTTNREDIWRWQMKGFADLAAATSPDIQVEIEIDGTISFARTATWQDRSDGYVFDLTQAPAPVDLCEGVTCSGADQCNNNGTCDPMTGTCGAPIPVTDGTVCDDANGSTTGDQCTSGICAGTP
jgi:hypothetical protein